MSNFTITVTGPLGSTLRGLRADEDIITGRRSRPEPPVAVT